MLALSLFNQLPEPACICDQATSTIVYANPAFASWTGYSAEELRSRSLKKLVYQKDFRNLYQRLAVMEQEQHLCDEIRLLAKNRSLKHAETMIGKIDFHGQSLYLCLWRDQSARKDREQELKQDILQEKQKNAALTQTMLPFVQIMEKMQVLPACLREFAKCQGEAATMEKAVQLLCHRQGLRYAQAALLIRNGDYLDLVTASKPWPIRHFHLGKQHKLARAARDGQIQVLDNGAEYIVPFTTEHGNGLLQIELSENDRLLVQEDENLQCFHSQLLETVCEFLGLWLQCIRHRQLRDHAQQRDTLTGQYLRRYFFDSIGECCQTNDPAAMVVLALHHPTHGLWEKEEEAVQTVSALLEQYKPAQSVIGYTSQREFALLVPHVSLAQITTWLEQWKQKARKAVTPLLHCVFDFPAAVVMLDTRRPVAPTAETTIAGAVFSWVSTLWSQAMTCLDEAKRQGGDKIFYWHDGTPKMAKRISTKLR